MSVDTNTAADTTTDAPVVDEAAQAAELAAHEATVDSFKAAANTAVESADETTGTIVAADLEPAKVAYRAITGGAKFKNAAKRWIEEQMKAALSSGVTGVPKAVAWNTLQDEAVAAPAAKGPSEPKVTVSPNKAFADRVNAHRIALELIEDADLPEGVTEDWEGELDDEDTVQAAAEYLKWVESDKDTRGDEPEVSPVIKTAIRLVSTKAPKKAGRPSGKPFNGQRRDVAAHIREVFEAKGQGEFLTISQIAGASSSVYGDDHPSSGAVNNRIFPPNGSASELVDVLTPGVNGDGTKGATKN